MHDVIDASGLTKAFVTESGVLNVLQDVDIRVRAREFITITGPSGSGKSTLLNLLACLDTPTSGRYRLLGEDVLSYDDRALAEARNRCIGFVFQSFNLLPRLTILENVALPMVYAGFPRAARESRAATLLEQFGLGSKMRMKPAQLSGGQQQRVAIARALVNRPALLLADEPTGSLDTQSAFSILELLAELNETQGVTVILVTHDPRVAARGSRTLCLRDGRVVHDMQTRRF